MGHDVLYGAPATRLDPETVVDHTTRPSSACAQLGNPRQLHGGAGVADPTGAFASRKRLLTLTVGGHAPNYLANRFAGANGDREALLLRLKELLGNDLPHALRSDAQRIETGILRPRRADRGLREHQFIEGDVRRDSRNAPQGGHRTGTFRRNA